MRMVETDDGVRLRTWTTGTATGLPPVLLIHGGPGLWDYLGPVARMLEPLTTVHRFDHRGCGGSDASDAHTFARYRADIESLRRQWGHETWSVVGHSFGATLAFAYAVAHPDRTSALGYLSGPGLGDWRGPAAAEAARRMTPRQRQRRAELEERANRTRDEEIEYRALCWFTDHADREHAWEWAVEDASVDHPINWTANRALMAETRRHAEAELLAEAESSADRPRLLRRSAAHPGSGAGRIGMPCWFIHGAGDPRPVSTVAALAAAIPQATLNVIEGAGHHPWRERPGELTTLLRALATGAAATPAAGRAPAPGRASRRPAGGRSGPAAE
jgi:proline iminopeptidase